MILRDPTQKFGKHKKLEVSMKVLTKWVAALGIIGAALVGTTVFAYEYKFVCHSKDLNPPLEINGEFAIERDSMLGRGEVEVTQDASEGDQYDVAFYRGMWTSDRLNFYLRTEAGEQLAVVVIEDFFKNNRFALSGYMQGEYGNSGLNCYNRSYNRSCSECFDDPFPTDHCRAVCGCSSPFCGAW